MKTKVALTAMAVIVIMTLVLSGCGATPARNTLLIGGAWDMLSMPAKISPVYQEKADPLSTQFTPDPISDLKSGELDVVVMGRDPLPEDLSDVDDTVVAYDAICFIIDENSFMGGIAMDGSIPAAKADPLDQLSKEDIRGLFSYWTATSAERWTPRGAYFIWSNMNAGYGFTLKDKMQLWELRDKPVIPWSKFIPGKYDTQTLLYQDLSLDEKTVANTWNKQYASPELNYEEEVLSKQYMAGAYAEGTGDFQYKIGFCSRRVAQLALAHIPVKVIPIDGIDPITDTKTIYDGSYPFSRKIHILTRKNVSQSASQFVTFLLSNEGQQALAKAGYLPIQKEAN